MFRNSMLYRRWWYVKRRNLRRFRLMLRLMITAFIVYVAYVISQSNLPHLFIYFFSS